MAHLGLSRIHPHPAGANGRFACPMNDIPKTKWKDVADGLVGGSYPRIPFEYIGARSGHGVHLQQLAACGPGPVINQVVANGTDLVFAGTGLERIHFHIMWPGYSHVKYARTIELNTTHGPMTRGQLAATIAAHYWRFVDKMDEETVQTDFKQFELKRNRLNIGHMVLMSLRNTGPGDVYQAEIEIEWK